MSNKILKVSKLIFLFFVATLGVLFLVFAFCLLCPYINTFKYFVFEMQQYYEIPRLIISILLLLLCILYFFAVSLLCGYLIFRIFVPLPKYTYEEHKAKMDEKKALKQARKKERLKQKLNELEKGE